MGVSGDGGSGGGGGRDREGNQGRHQIADQGGCPAGVGQWRIQ